MKKYLLGFAMLLAAGTTFAQEEFLSVSPSTISLKPGETQDVVVTYHGPVEKGYFYNAFQLVIDMPEGVEPTWLVKKGKVTSNVQLLNSLADQNMTFAENFVSFDDPENTTGISSYRLGFLFTQDGYAIPYGPDDGEEWENIEEDLFKIRLLATDKVQTGEFNLSVNGIKFTYPEEVDGGGETTQIGVPFEDVPLDYQLGINFEIGSTGYATLCWPTALDFTAITGEDFQANIGVGVTGTTFMALSAVEKVPASTPLVIKGTPGVYSLTTTKGDVEDVSESILSGTPNATLKVSEGANIYALASKTEGIGFYRCQTDVVIPQYKAYFAPEAAAAEAYLFEETTGINQATVETSDADIYTISGVKVANASQKGVYIVNGKKVVVK
ncbi:MAG: hypothetical protein IKH88_00270 [Prevotella sp.]|nr:hypothetical protein [Prevotella sp.]MBR7054760.1 hypothetical protein [Prevotella sp.]